MTEETGSVEAGNPAPDAGEVAAVEAAPVSAPASEAEPASQDWLSSIENTELRTLAETKGWDKGGPESVLSSYHNLEKLFGADKAGRAVVLPAPDADEAVMSEFYNKLGRPDKADGYDLPVPEGQDGQMAEWASGVFHEAGLTARQAKIVSEKWNDHVGSLQQDGEAQNTQTAQDAEAELKREWGAAYDQKVVGINQAATALNMTEEHLAGLRSAMGPAAAMRFVDGLAGKMGEAPNDTGGFSEGVALTPSSAASELSKLSLDKEFMDAWMNKNHPAHNWAMDKKQRLAKMVDGVGA